MRQDPKVGAVATIRVWSRFLKASKSANKNQAKKDTHFRFFFWEKKDLFVSGTEKTAKMFNENFLHSIFNLDTYLGLRDPGSPNLRMVSWNLNTKSVSFRWWRTPFAYHLRIWLDQVIHPLKGPVFGRTGDSAGIINGITWLFFAAKPHVLQNVLGGSDRSFLTSWEVGHKWKCCKLFAEQKWAELENKQNKKTTSSKCKTSI